jgi:hypothetical protein
MGQRKNERTRTQAITRRYRTIALGATIAGLLSCGSAAAQSGPMFSQWFVRGGAYFPAVDTKASAKASDGSFATTIDFESDLGLADSKTLPIIDAAWRFSPRHRLEFNYLALDRDATTKITGSITWEDQTYPVNTRVRGEFNSTIAALSYVYSFYQTQDAELAAGLGLHGAKLKAGLSAQDTNIGVSREASASAPLPVLALRGAMKFSDTVGGELRYQWFGLKYGDYDGSLNVGNASVNYFPWKNVGFEAGYNYSRYDLKVSKESWRGEVKYTFNGPTLSVLMSF